MERHLTACTVCAAALDELRRAAADFSRAVAVLDARAPVVAEFVPRSYRPPLRAFTRARGALLRAAAVVLMAGGVAWGALPGSPVRLWLGQVWDDRAEVLEGRGGAEVEEPDASAVLQSGATLSGVSILPVDGAARVVLKEMAPATRVRVRMVEGRQLTVQWIGGGADPHFRTAPGRVEVLRGGPGSLLVEVPQASRTVIEVDNRVFAIAEGGVLRPLVAAEGDGGDIVFPTLKSGD